jgi:putative ABC transport system permease protein
MAKIIHSVLSGLRRSPVKSLVTILTVALGSGVLMVAITVSDVFGDLAAAQDGSTILTVGNVEANSDGEFERMRPPEFDEDIVEVLEQEVPGTYAVSAVASPRGGDYRVNGENYRISSVLGANADYFDLFGLQAAAGTFFTEAEDEAGAKVAVISEALASQLFGSAETAVGETFQSEARVFQRERSNSGNNASILTNYEVIGVYEDPGDFLTEAYGIPDMVIPIYNAIPDNIPQAMRGRSVAGILYIGIDGLSTAQAESTIKELVYRESGDDVTVEVWEGTPLGNSNALEETRNTTRTFSLVINLLGFVVLVAGSIGIFSITMVDVLGRTREMALERAIGASQQQILGEFVARSVIMSAFSVVLGTVVAAVMCRGPRKSVRI